MCKFKAIQSPIIPRVQKVRELEHTMKIQNCIFDRINRGTQLIYRFLMAKLRIRLMFWYWYRALKNKLL